MIRAVHCVAALALALGCADVRADEPRVSDGADGAEANPAVEKPTDAPDSKIAPGAADGQAKPGKNDEKNGAKKPLLDPEVTEGLRELIFGKEEKKPKSAEKDGATTEDPLESAIRGMRSATAKMAGKQTGEETRAIQKKVIEDLDKLIEQAQNQSQKPPPSSSSSPENTGESGQDKQGSKDPNGGKPRQKSSEQDESAGSGNAGQKQESSKARESSDEQRAAREREAELARRRDLIKDVWGHLPPTLRQQLLNIRDERSVPKYDELVRRYFESLAEEGTLEKRR